MENEVQMRRPLPPNPGRRTSRIVKRYRLPPRKLLKHMSSNILGRVIRTSVNAIRPTYRGLLGIQSPLKESCAAFKVKSMLKLRCRHCYFVRVDGRLEVKCLVHPRHCAKEIFNVKLLW